MAITQQNAVELARKAHEVRKYNNSATQQRLCQRVCSRAIESFESRFANKRKPISAEDARVLNKLLETWLRLRELHLARTAAKQEVQPASPAQLVRLREFAGLDGAPSGSDTTTGSSDDGQRLGDDNTSLQVPHA